MVQATPFLLLLSLALVAPGFSADKCMLTGDWTNNAGSKLTIGAVDEDGKFCGSYCTVPKDLPDVLLCSPLKGLQKNPNTDSRNIFGFIVNWNFTDHITVYTGRCFADNSEETLETTSLELSPMDKTWKPTTIDTEIFYRQHKQEECGIAGDCKAHRSTCDANRICRCKTCF